MSLFSAVIPDGCVEVDASSSDYAGIAHAIGFRVNSTSAGTSVRVITAGGQTVTFDGLVVGENLAAIRPRNVLERRLIK